MKTPDDWGKPRSQWESPPSLMTDEELAEWLERYDRAISQAAEYRAELFAEVIRRLRKE